MGRWINIRSLSFPVCETALLLPSWLKTSFLLRLKMEVECGRLSEQLPRRPLRESYGLVEGATPPGP